MAMDKSKEIDPTTLRLDIPVTDGEDRPRNAATHFTVKVRRITAAARLEYQTLLEKQAQRTAELQRKYAAIDAEGSDSEPIPDYSGMTEEEEATAKRREFERRTAEILRDPDLFARQQEIASMTTRDAITEDLRQTFEVVSLMIDRTDPRLTNEQRAWIDEDPEDPDGTFWASQDLEYLEERRGSFRRLLGKKREGVAEGTGE